MSTNITTEFAALSKHAANPVYQAGVTAFRSGQLDSKCSYESKDGKGMGDQRTIWMTGYYNARILPLLKRSFGV